MYHGFYCYLCPQQADCQRFSPLLKILQILQKLFLSGVVLYFQ
uniref:Uncharacterized protein n=1 Tax=Physcomitrium patens TaxID=3218 RepID=A0A2K1IXB7_PHYPA|nr:hypothetical protein PHYPA_023735 [Physcomitrium patens]